MQTQPAWTTSIARLLTLRNGPFNATVIGVVLFTRIRPSSSYLPFLSEGRYTANIIFPVEVTGWKLRNERDGQREASFRGCVRKGGQTDRSISVVAYASIISGPGVIYISAARKSKGMYCNVGTQLEWRAS